MTRDELQTRTKSFALRVLKLTPALPESIPGRAIANPLVRSGTSVAANYRAVCRSRSRKEYIAKLGVVIEEADESAFWLEIIIEGGFMKPTVAQPLLTEATELVRIMAASRATAVRRAKDTPQKG
jgi:four helix bundle protein